MQKTEKNMQKARWWVKEEKSEQNVDFWGVLLYSFVK